MTDVWQPANSWLGCCRSTKSEANIIAIRLLGEDNKIIKIDNDRFSGDFSDSCRFDVNLKEGAVFRRALSE